MTHTIQPLTWVTALNTEKTRLTEAGENMADVNIRDILAVCDSLNKLCEKLNRLAYVLQRKNIETNLKKEGVK